VDYQQPWGTERHSASYTTGRIPKDLSRTAKSPIQLNRAHPETIFRVRVAGLKPQTTYYYRGDRDGEQREERWGESPVNQFTTPARASAS